ncbi:MAG: LemA family protein [Desulfomonile tiedjei]|nr:LemA family protein [Desulfomonile tiedjei]
MSLSRFIEFCFALLVAFLVLVFISFASLRPVLQQARSEAKAEWNQFLRAVAARNEAIPGLVEAIRGFEAGHGKLAEKILTARSISMRSNDPEAIVASVDQMDGFLGQIEKLAQANQDLSRYVPFDTNWKRTLQATYRVTYVRRCYNTNAACYNRLLIPFPQNLLTAVFGFLPLREYPASRTVSGPGGS